MSREIEFDISTFGMNTIPVFPVEPLGVTKYYLGNDGVSVLHKQVGDEYFGPDNRDIRELLPMVLLLRRMNFEQYSGPRFSEEYCQGIRRDVITVFEEGQLCTELPV